MNGAITIRADAELPSELAIDAAIGQGMRQFAEKCEEHQQVELINAIPVFRNDGVLFVTIIVKFEEPTNP